MTVTQLARRCGLSRGTLLYYESIGLIRPAGRSRSNYRSYGARELARLEQIRAYRGAGLKLEDIRGLLDGAKDQASTILKRRLAELNTEIDVLRGHQHAILKLLQTTGWRNRMVTKEKWISIMKSAGLTDEDMHRWHAHFERSAPEEHQEFLEFLHIPAEEIRDIREWSRKAGGTMNR